MKNFLRKPIVINAVLLLMFGAICFYAGYCAKPAEVVEVQTTKYVEVNGTEYFDTSLIEKFNNAILGDGQVRMVGGWVYSDGVVEDERGQLWGVDYSLSDEDNLLLWIADNNTPNNTVDDKVVKVWKEAY